jgi:alkylation response protein AidB-like acyl-CoA dehydrogenase/electron transfer flavoprotein alpha subunit
MPGEWAGTLWKFLSEHQDDPYETIRVLSSVSPALGLIGAHWFPTAGILKASGLEPEPAICAVDAHRLEIEESGDSVHIKGSLPLTPLAAVRTLLLLANGGGYLVPLLGDGVTITPTPAIGLRAAGFASVSLDCVVENDAMAVPAAAEALDAMSYLAIALGAADYLCRRVKEHALGRVQFPGQMLDTEGRDGIAKLGAVKAMIARTEAWRLLLETLFDTYSDSELRTHHPELNLLLSALASMAFSPEPGALGYDAGQVFGGFAYSEDDLLSRFYRDSALFRFLVPGQGAAEKLHQLLVSRNPGAAFPSLDRLAGLRTEPLGKHCRQWADLAGKCAGIFGEADARLAGQARALVIGIGILFTRIENGLALGTGSEAGTALIEVMLEVAEDALNAAALSAGRGGVSPDALFPFEPRGTAVVLKEDYESFCTAPGAPHRSGGFLMSSFERAPRFVPEIQLHDQRLRARWTELVTWFKTNCRDRQFEGLFIERYIEKIHNLPAEIIAAVKENQWLATYIPKSEDGLGWRKAEYYILNSAAGNFGDAGINLLIMASTSIGTTPILLGLEDELPRVREELAPLMQDANRLGEIGVRLEKLIRSFANPNPAWIRKEFETTMKLVDARIRHTRVVKYLAANFLRAFYGAGIAGQRGDFNGFISGLRRAAELFARLAPDVHAALEELPRRERCHRLFLRYLGHGGISAFALTEPTAGSDSGGVKTTAKLRSSKLTPLVDGRYAFRVEEQDEKSMRYLIDADKLEFTETGPAYRTPDNLLAQIRFDRYDYSVDQGARYYMHDGKACEFHDIGQVRTSPSGPLYEYYSLTGAKMWITNGSVATQFCLFAQTQEGVTGFMVDRHSEGLKVGADERKMGQRGSPTNEISIDSVRVPREAVIGYEGHGQVNALETLNVGRCGLAVVSGALMHKLLEESRQSLPATPDRDRLLGEAAAILFGSESLAFYLVGLFDRPHESVRMESAIAKYACSEDIHELISLVEFAFGPEGQTEKFLIEKARRDARILTIYEGTNEVQRFLILKDLISLAPTWPVLTASSEDKKAAVLAEWKNRLRSQVREAAGLLGDTAWADAMLQPALFPLAEMAGEVLRLECIFFRMEWLEKQGVLLAQSDPRYVPSLLEAGKRAAVRTVARLAMINEKFMHGWSQIRENINTPEVRAADAALDSYRAAPETGIRSMTPLQARLRVLCIVRPVADLSPVPRLSGGAISEIVWMNNTRDHAGIQQALALKARSGALVTVDVLFVGSSGHEHLIRESAGAADRIVRLNSDHASPAAIAEAVAALELLNPYDVITMGWSCLDGEQGTGAVLAGILGRNHYRKAGLEVLQDGKGLEHIAPPAVISVTAAADRTLPDLSTIVASSFADILVLHPSKTIASEPAPRFESPVPASAAAKTVTTAQDAAAYLRDYAVRARSAHASDYQGEPGRSGLAHGNAVWTILDPREQKVNASVIRAGSRIASAHGLPMHAIVPAPRELWPALLGSAYENGANRAYCLDTGNGMLSAEGKRELMRVIMKTAEAPLVLADSYWDEAFCLVAGQSVVAGRQVRVFSNLVMIDSEEQPGSLLIPAYDGKLNRREPLGKSQAFFTTVASDAEFGVTEKQNDFAATILDFPLSAEWIMPLPPPSLPTLSQADVIIDLGYGIKDRSGFVLAQKLKKKLEALGLSPFFGATRKVTQDLRLLPVEHQIGQTGVRVNPKLIIALGISGAPQHIDYIGTRAEVLCFNKDPEAPLMKLNQDRQAPRIHPIVGDLFATVPDLIDRLS